MQMMMKTIVLIISIFVGIQVFAQNGEYKSLEQCKNDTITYVKYNFKENKSRYVGKPMKFLLDEIDLEMMTNDFYTSATGPYVTADHQSKINGLFLCYLQYFEVENYETDKRLFYVVLITFQVPPYTHDDEEFWALTNKYDEDDFSWRPDFYDLFKEYVVKDIILHEYHKDGK